MSKRGIRPSGSLVRQSKSNVHTRNKGARRFYTGGALGFEVSPTSPAMCAPPRRARAQPVPGLNIRSSGQPVNVVQRDTRTDAERRAALRNDYERATGGGGGGEGGGGGRLNERGGGATRMGARGRNAPRQAHAPRDW